MKGTAETEMFQGDAGRDAVEPDKRTRFIKTAVAHGSYRALLNLHSETVEQTIVMNSLLKFATDAHGGLGR